MSVEALPAAYRADPIGYYADLKARVSARGPARKPLALSLVASEPEKVIVADGRTPEQREIDRLVANYREYLEGTFMSLPPAPRFIIRRALKHFGITHEELISARRTQAIVAIRHQVMWALRTATPISLPHIGRLLGNRDHTTVLHGWKKIQGEIDAGLREAPNWWMASAAEAAE